MKGRNVGNGGRTDDKRWENGERAKKGKWENEEVMKGRRKKRKKR